MSARPSGSRAAIVPAQTTEVANDCARVRRNFHEIWPGCCYKVNLHIVSILLWVDGLLLFQETVGADSYCAKTIVEYLRKFKPFHRNSVFVYISNSLGMAF